MRSRRIAWIAVLLLAVVGWLAFANLQVRVTPVVLADDPTIAAVSEQLTRGRVEVLTMTDAAQRAAKWTALAGLTTGHARELLEAQAAAEPGAMPTLRFTAEPEALVAWRDADEAMVQVAYGTDAGGPVIELHLLWLMENGWQVAMTWLVSPDPDPAAPLVPADDLDELLEAPEVVATGPAEPLVAALPLARVGEPYTHILALTDPELLVSEWQVGYGLDMEAVSGLAFDPATAMLSGTPDTAGEYHLIVSFIAQDADGVQLAEDEEVALSVISPVEARAEPSPMPKPGKGRGGAGGAP